MMASLVLQVVRRMVAGTCPFLGLYLDMDLGTVTPSYVTPEAVVRLVSRNYAGSTAQANLYPQSQQGE